MNSHVQYEFTLCMNLHEKYEFVLCMNSHEEYEFTQYLSDCMNSHVPLCVFVPDKEGNCLTDSHVKLNSFDDMQECLSNSNHKIGFDYNKDTMSLAEELTLDA